MYLIAIIGKELNEINYDSGSEPDNIFKYDNKLFIKLVDANIKQLILDVAKVPEFYFSVVDHELNLIFNSSLTQEGSCKELSLRQITSRNRIINDFLQNGNGDMLTNSKIDTNEIKELNQFYDLEHDLSVLFQELKSSHQNEEELLQDVPQNIQHIYLNPVLRPYQIDGIRWMINREIKPQFLPTEFIAVRTIPKYCNDVTTIFYYNPRTHELIDTEPCAIPIPSGGILADEMGLGKTVEILSLILLNQKKKRKLSELCQDEQVTTDDESPISNGILKPVVCICKKTISSTQNTLMFCTKCKRYQHKNCVLKYVENDNVDRSSSYICPSCWRNHELIESSATIIVSPTVIKEQWRTEILKHIRNKNFKVFVYNGITDSGWINPMDLSKFDVVLTDYNVLKSEIYYANASESRGALRYEKRFLNPISPITRVKWWRVCLDESQMVETPANLCSKMVKSLNTTHRWSITGTPVEKKIDNLYGLLYFLDCHPYTDFTKWLELSHAFKNGDNKPLIQVLSKIMWRTCKADVLDQINIPPQTTLVHYVNMSNVEAFFYKNQHEFYFNLLRNKAMKIQCDLPVSKLDPHTLKLLMDPLLKIRMDCTIPSIFQKHASNSSTVKKFLQPKELVDVLIANNENDCKSELRSIVSSLNGMAGIHIIRKEFYSAIKLYKNIMKRASEQEFSNITVDTLQQIHAVHNLIEIVDGDENLCEYKEKLSNLETKYIGTYYSLIKQCEDQLGLSEKYLDQIISKVDTNWEQGNWISDLLNKVGDDHETNVMSRIRFELQSYTVTDDISSFYGIQYVLLVWWTDLLKSRQNLIKNFSELNYFTKNINAKNIPIEISQKIEHLIKLAYECHLKMRSGQNEKKTKKCEICILNTKLMEYECFLFDKHSSANSNGNVGTWNHTHQEFALKIVLNSLQSRISTDTIEVYENYMELIEAFKKEFKMYSKLWIEINYTVSAYDELNMCKTRLQARDPCQMTKEDNYNKSLISIYDVDDEFMKFQDQLQQSELDYVKIQGRIKYLNHLKQKTEPEVCPICTKKPENKYIALQCGHIMCPICLAQMKMYQKSFLICCICRNKQSYNEVYDITCKPSESTDSKLTFNGDYPSKIEAIVRKILELKADDDTVKIIIFSQWNDILKFLSNALVENGITFCLNSHKIQLCLSNFKDPTKKITCLLLPLKFGSKGLNLIEATHVFMVEPILNPGEELQAIGRIHRIGQTRKTFVHKFIVQQTIEETIYQRISNDKTGAWSTKRITVENLSNLF